MPLRSDLSSSAIARSQVVSLVESWASDELVRILRLLVSEVVTNAIVHGGPGIHLEVAAIMARTVRVEVFDTSLELPQVQTPPPGGVSGRGLQLVETLADRWGARRRADGKVVWFELRENTSEPRQLSPTGAPRSRRVGG
jgi:anti-sigma regulatory factor (Ser/Thr protein kinase)